MFKKRFVALLLCGLFLTGSAAAATISDVPADNWCYPYANFLVEKEIMPLDQYGSFYPDVGTSRGDFVLYIWRAAGSPQVVGAPHWFSDVSADDDWYTAVAWAYQVGITTGITDTVFEPYWVLTREQAFTFLHRCLAQFGVSGYWDGTDYLSGFHDQFDVSDWAVEPMNFLYQVGIVTGTDNGYLMPRVDVSNAHTATILYKTLALAEGG